jgi:hypothetical protein
MGLELARTSRASNWRNAVNKRKKWIMQNTENIALFDGLDDAIVGIASRPNLESLAVYDMHRIMRILEQQMDPEDAAEHFDANIACMYCGPLTPLIMARYPAGSRSSEVSRLRAALEQIASNRDEPYAADFARDILARREVR